ncbi:MAG: hypothetical protein ABIA04_13805 [Pseudomonadota bacterium]
MPENKSPEESNNSEKFRFLTQKLSQMYPDYSFDFVDSYRYYSTQVQVFYYEKKHDQSHIRRRRARGCMLTFNENPGDVIWNLQGSDKRSIFELLKVHDRVGKNKNLSQNLFRGSSFKHSDEIGYVRQDSTNIYKKNYKPKLTQEVDGNKAFSNSANSEEKSKSPKSAYKSQKKTPSPPQYSKPEKPTNDLMEKFKQAAKDKGWMK